MLFRVLRFVKFVSSLGVPVLLREAFEGTCLKLLLFWVTFKFFSSNQGCSWGISGS